jgi:hypothetical protein
VAVNHSNHAPPPAVIVYLPVSMSIRGQGEKAQSRPRREGNRGVRRILDIVLKVAGLVVGLCDVMDGGSMATLE